MTPNSFAYIVFLVIGALIYHPLSQKAKKPFLLLLSICFYAIGGVKFLPLLALTVAFNFFAAQKLERTERKRGLLTLVLVLNLGALGLFKYLGFFGELLGCTGVQLSLPQLALPIGISFYTFVICGYMIDVYRGREAERNFLDFALFTTFFPAILSGPIERSKNLLPQIKQPRRATADDVRFAAERLIEGTVKKVLLADNLAILVNTAYADPAQFSGLELAFAAVAYALQIYCDFSAYSDMAIGSARLFGITLMENFHAPYMAQSSKEFWHRWHISLSTWFRDYLYFPLGGSRKGKARTYINVLIVFALSGLWHGAAMKYVLWGLLFGVFQVIGGLLTPAKQRLCAALHIPWDAGWLQIIRVIITFGLSTFAWIFFRADSALQACAIIKRIVTAAGACFPLNLTHLRSDRACAACACREPHRTGADRHHRRPVPAAGKAAGDRLAPVRGLGYPAGSDGRVRRVRHRIQPAGIRLFPVLRRNRRETHFQERTGGLPCRCGSARRYPRRCDPLSHTAAA